MKIEETPSKREQLEKEFLSNIDKIERDHKKRIRIVNIALFITKLMIFSVLAYFFIVLGKMIYEVMKL